MTAEVSPTPVIGKYKNYIREGFSLGIPQGESEPKSAEENRNYSHR
jgi:hypothetical protein